MIEMTEKVLAAIRHPILAYVRRSSNLDFTELLLHERLQSRGLLDDITTVIDAGAHYGDYARLFSYVMPAAKIICFEPVPDTFKILQEQTASKPQISAYCMALGGRAERVLMNVSGMDQASSLLEMTDVHRNLWPDSAPCKPVKVEVTTLDAFVAEHAITGDILLKADVQGFELELLKGAKSVLRQIRLIRLEVSFVPLYQGAPAFSEVCAFLETNGFRLHSMVGDVKALGHELPVQGDFLFINSTYKNPKESTG